MRSMRSFAVIVMVAWVAALLAGCGIPDECEPRAVAPVRIPD